MTNTKLFLLIGTSLYLIPNLASAQCVATQDCATLGYTETSCSGGSGVKCPFGNKWACFKSESEVCQKYGFTYSCNQDNETGPYGDSCNNKYASCSCAEGYIWQNDHCQLWNGGSDYYYYCDGQVVAVKTPEMEFYVALQDINDPYLTYYEASDACYSYTFCKGKKGKMPSLEQLRTIYNNLNDINNLLSENGGTKITGDSYWSNTYEYWCQKPDCYYWILYMYDGHTYAADDQFDYPNARPIL